VVLRGIGRVWSREYFAELPGRAGRPYTWPMSAPPFLVHGAIAFQLSSRLDAYGRDVGAMLVVPFDPELYRRVTGHVDAMRLYAAELPSVSVAWTEVMICHFELMHGLWRTPAKQQPAQLTSLRSRLEAASARLAQRCLVLMPAA
jgi:hypothetical protein